MHLKREIIQYAIMQQIYLRNSKRFLYLFDKDFQYIFRGNDASFTTSHVQLVPGYPSQDGNDVDIQFYVEYPGGGTMSQAILLLIINEQLSSIQTNTGLQLTIETTIEVPTQPPPTQDNKDNAVTVVLTDFPVDQVCYNFLIPITLSLIS